VNRTGSNVTSVESEMIFQKFKFNENPKSLGHFEIGSRFINPVDIFKLGRYLKLNEHAPRNSEIFVKVCFVLRSSVTSDLVQPYFRHNDIFYFIHINDYNHKGATVSLRSGHLYAFYHYLALVSDIMLVRLSRQMRTFIYFWFFIGLFVPFKHFLLQVNIKKAKTFLTKEINQLKMN